MKRHSRMNSSGAYFFVGVTQQRLREKQYSFLRSLMLGTRDYLGQRPKNAHHWMVISDDLFDYRLELMASCMRAHGIGEALIQRLACFSRNTFALISSSRSR